MKKFSVLLALIFVCSSLFAQDIITKKNGEVIEAKIIEVSDVEVRYLNPSSQEGPVLVIPRNEISLITFSDGTIGEVPPVQEEPSSSFLSDEDFKSLRPNMPYSELVKIYDVNEYSKFTGWERNNPAVMGLCSFMFTGLGQMINGAMKRGLYFFLGSSACYVGMYALALGDSYITSRYGHDSPGFVAAAVGMGLGMIGIKIYSIVDAVKVTKIMNMYYDDLDKLSFDFSVAPYCDVICMNTEATPVAGLSLRLSF